MLKLSKLTDYGTVVMTALATDAARLRNAQELATLTHLSAPTVSKLLNMLMKDGLIESVRGARGGYRLSRPAEAITVADIIRALEGPIALTQCSVHTGNCSIESQCGTRTNWRLINTAIKQALEAVNLAQMAAPAVRKEDPVTFFRPSAAGPEPRPSR